MAKTNKYPKEIDALKDIKNINKIMSNLCLTYNIEPSGIATMFSTVRGIERFAIIKDYENSPIKDIFTDIYIPANEFRTFLSNYTKTNTKFSITEDGIYYEDHKKEISISLNKFDLEYKDFYNLLFINKPFTNTIMELTLKNNFIPVDDSIIEALENGESVNNDGILISKAIINPKYMNRLSYLNIDIPDNHYNYRLYKSQYDVIDIYTIVAYLKINMPY